MPKDPLCLAVAPDGLDVCTLTQSHVGAHQARVPKGRWPDGLRWWQGPTEGAGLVGPDEKPLPPSTPQPDPNVRTWQVGAVPESDHWPAVSARCGEGHPANVSLTCTRLSGHLGRHGGKTAYRNAHGDDCVVYSEWGNPTPVGSTGAPTGAQPGLEYCPRCDQWHLPGRHIEPIAPAPRPDDLIGATEHHAHVPSCPARKKRTYTRADCTCGVQTFSDETRGLGVPPLLNQLAQNVGGKIESVGALPDGSGFATMSMPLPAGHWLHADHENIPPMPFRLGTDDPDRKQVEDKLREAGRYAVRTATMNGKEPDFDPDALVQNLITGCLGYFTPSGLSEMDGGRWNPRQPEPPKAVQQRFNVTRFYGTVHGSITIDPKALKPGELAGDALDREWGYLRPMMIDAVRQAQLEDINARIEQVKEAKREFDTTPAVQAARAAWNPLSPVSDEADHIAVQERRADAATGTLGMWPPFDKDRDVALGDPFPPGADEMTGIAPALLGRNVAPQKSELTEADLTRASIRELAQRRMRREGDELRQAMEIEHIAATATDPQSAPTSQPTSIDFQRHGALRAYAYMLEKQAPGAIGHVAKKLRMLANELIGIKP